MLRYQEQLESPPSPLEVEWDPSIHFEALIKPNQPSWENQLTIRTSTLENLHTQRQSDSKKKCLILKNVWAMSFWSLEIIDANDSIILELREKENI